MTWNGSVRGIFIFFQEQKWVVAILFMVPVYASESVRFYLSEDPLPIGSIKFWLVQSVILANSLSCINALSFFFFFPPQIVSLTFPKLSLACDILRNCYEAFALYSFGRYLIACLGKSRPFRIHAC